MAHESFEHEGVAALVNELTVPIKVDREERPDVDAVYMTATQAMTGQGGWPMTVFATPDGEPFFCGTYFPRDAFAAGARRCPTRGATSATRYCGRARQWSRRSGRSPRGRRRTRCTRACWTPRRRAWSSDYDKEHGGFGGAPKFPPHMDLLFLLRHYQRTRDDEALDIVRYTCERMARGGMYDQLAGGFARYAVDGTWTVPHFEKMLYDNALLLRVVHAAGPHRRRRHRAAGRRRDRRVPAARPARRARVHLGAGRGHRRRRGADLRVDAGAARRGARRDRRRLGGRYLLEVTDDGTFEHGASVLQLPEDPLEPGALAATSRSACWPPGTPGRSRPATARSSRRGTGWRSPRWSSTARCTATARPSGAPSTRPRYLADDAHRRRAAAAGVARRRRRRAGRRAGGLRRVAEAFCAVHQATGDGAWLDLAGQLLDVALERFADRRRRVLRHRRRRRAAGQPAGRRHRQRDAVRPVGDRGGAGRRTRR